MSFQVFAVAAKSQNSNATGVSASLKRLRGAPAKLSFSLTQAKAKELSWSEGDMLEVLIGDGEHHGLVRLRKNNSVGTARVSRRAMRSVVWFGVALGHVPAFVNRSESKKHCQNEVVIDGWLEIVLPSWADETGRVARAAPPSRLPGPNRAVGRDVAPNLMGDPSPSRSALAGRK